MKPSTFNKTPPRQTYSGVRSAAVAAASRSWWIDEDLQRDREKFSSAAREERPRIASSPVGDKIDALFN